MGIIFDFAGVMIACVGVIMAMAGYFSAAALGLTSSVIFFIGLALIGVGWAVFNTQRKR